MNQVTEAVKKMFAAFNNTQQYCLAYSGGIDSQVLLHVLAQHKPPSCQLRAIHIHHGLQIAADVWAEHCAEQARWLNVSLTIKHVNAKAPKGKSPEACARAARYAALAEMITEGEVLVTAHNQNDQAETVLLQLLRGAGVKGLAAMPEQSAFNSGLLYRPLLNVSRVDIEKYAAEHQLSWVEDPSNVNTHFDRNFLRQKIMPLIAERWPSFAQTLARSAQHCAEASALIEECAEQDLKLTIQHNPAILASPCLTRGPGLQAVRSTQDPFNNDASQLCRSGPRIKSGETTPSPSPLSIKALLSLTVARQRQVLRHWLVRQQFPVPSTTQLESLFRDVIHAAEDKMPLMQWAGVELRRFKDYLFAMLPLSPFDPSLEIEWDGRTPLVLPAELGVLSPDDPRLLSLNNPLSQNVKREPLAALQEFPLSRKTPSFLLMINLNEVQIPPESPITQGFSLKQELLPITIRFRRGGERLRVPGREGRHELKKLFQEWGVLPWRRDRVPLIYVGAELLGVLLSPDDCFHGFNG